VYTTGCSWSVHDACTVHDVSQACYKKTPSPVYVQVSIQPGREQRMQGASIEGDTNQGGNGQLLDARGRGKTSRTGRKAPSEPTSIAAMLASCADFSDGQGSIPSRGASEHGATAEVQNCLSQLSACATCPIIESTVQADKTSLMHALWQIQLKAGKFAARVDAIQCQERSQRMARLQMKVSKLSLQMSQLQQQLQVM